MVMRLDALVDAADGIAIAASNAKADAMDAPKRRPLMLAPSRTRG
jgi:hypothetical protein